jgi:hypothetical protein
VRAVAYGSGKPPSAEPTRERRPPSPVRADEAVVGGANLDMDICVEDYRVGGVMMFDAHTGRGLVGEFFTRGLGLEQDCGARSDAGQLAVVPARWRPRWLRWWPRRRVLRRTHGPNFAPAVISSAAAVKDVAGSVFQ